jgi:hypothetical protein
LTALYVVLIGVVLRMAVSSVVALWLARAQGK